MAAAALGVAGAVAGAAEILDVISTRAPLRGWFRWGTSTTLARTIWSARWGSMITGTNYFL